MPRWAWGLFGALFYIEMVVILTLKVHLPQKPDPVFKKPEPVEYNWTPGPYDNDWDHCWQEQQHGVILCEEDQI